MAEQNSGLFWREHYAEAVEPELTPVEQQLRDLFVKEYLHDRDPILAAIRCGFNKCYAEQYGTQFLGESYVQRKLAALEQAEEEDEAERIAADKRAVLSVLRQASLVGPYASRVAAAAKLAAILGMDAPAKSEQTITHRGGVMAVPAIANLDEWEKAAQVSQDKLVSDTRA